MRQNYPDIENTMCPLNDSFKSTFCFINSLAPSELSLERDLREHTLCLQTSWKFGKADMGRLLQLLPWVWFCLVTISEGNGTFRLLTSDPHSTPGSIKRVFCEVTQEKVYLCAKNI